MRTDRAHNTEVQLCKENGVLLFKGDGMRAYIRERRKYKMSGKRGIWRKVGNYEEEGGPILSVALRHILLAPSS